MFAPLETALRSHLAGAIPDIPVLGTYDLVDLTQPDSARVAMQVVWLGAGVTDRRRSAIALAHRFVVHIYVDCARARDLDREQATQGMDGVVQRLLSFEPTRLQFGNTQDIPAPEFDGRTLRLSLYLNITDVVRATKEE